MSEVMRFENPQGFSLVPDPAKSTWWTTIYQYRAKTHPLTFVHSDGTRYQPDKHFFTDQGSIPRFPPFVRMCVCKDRFLGFYLHDSGYMDGGLWTDGVFRHMTRKQVDDLLYEMILADPIPGNKATAWLIWVHVRMYGGFCGWHKRDVGKTKPPTIDPHQAGGVIRQA